MENQQTEKKGIKLKNVFLIILGTIILTAVGTGFLIKTTLFASPLKPVELSAKEQRQFDNKVALFEKAVGDSPSNSNISRQSKQSEKNEDGTLKPEAYSEDGASRSIDFTEREVNALIAKNTDLADKVAIDFDDNLVSIKLLMPMDPDFPVLGGKTLKLHAGAELAYQNGRPIVKIRGVSLMGIPMPNAWLGGLKNVDLVKESTGNNQFWQTFAAGVEDIHVSKDKLHLVLKE